MDYKRKVDFAIKLLRSIPQDGPIEVSYSGGKDSDVILRLTQMAGIPYEAIYKNTTIDPPGTIAHCKAKGVRIVNPEKRFFDLVKEKGFPTRFQRFCCGYLKEYKIHDRAIQGIRREESRKRAERYKEPEFCRAYPHKEKARIYLPILEWGREDVERFVEDEGVKCHPLYYDENGKFHAERRLGCLGCPLQSIKNRRDAYKQYPKMLLQSMRALKVYYEKHPNSPSAKIFDYDVYEKFYADLFYNSPSEYRRYNEGLLFKDKPTKQFLEEYFGIDLTL